MQTRPENGEDWEEPTAEELPDRLTTSAVLKAIRRLETKVEEQGAAVRDLAEAVKELAQAVRRSGR